MRFWAHDRFTIPLPAGHRFPICEVRAPARARRGGSGSATVCESPRRVVGGRSALVHDAAVPRARARPGRSACARSAALGLPWSPELVERGRRSSQGTVEAARDALRDGVGMNLGGGTHHAGADAGRGYCLFNDVVLAVRVLRAGPAAS